MPRRRPDPQQPEVPAWTGRARADALRWTKHLGRSTNTPCVLCNQPIDYDLEYPDPASCSVEHLLPRSTHPHLTWVRTNWAPAHLDCNKTRTRTATTELGHTTTDW